MVGGVKYLMLNHNAGCSQVLLQRSGFLFLLTVFFFSLSIVCFFHFLLYNTMTQTFTYCNTLANLTITFLFYFVRCLTVAVHNQIDNL